MQKKTRIDSHHHFWKYDAKQYAWIDDKKAMLRHDFLPANLKVEIDKAGIEGVVSVQARQTVEETRWLLEMAGRNPYVHGVVGWAPLIDPKVAMWEVAEVLNPPPCST